MVIRNENPPHPLASFHLEQELARLRDGSAVLLSLPKHAHKAQFSNGTCCQLRIAPCAKAFHPIRNLRMELMLQYGERKKSIHIQ